MSLIFSQLVYVDYFGVGGHGGVGMHADREQRNNEIVNKLIEKLYNFRNILS